MINYFIFGKSEECDFYRKILEHSGVRVGFLSIEDDRAYFSEMNSVDKEKIASVEFFFDKSLKFFFSPKSVGFLLALLMARSAKINTLNNAGSTLFISANNFFDIILMEKYFKGIRNFSEQDFLFYTSKFKNLNLMLLNNKELLSITSMDYKSILHLVYGLDNHILTSSEILYSSAYSDKGDFSIQDNDQFFYQRHEILSVIINRFGDMDLNQRNVFFQFLTKVKRGDLEITVNDKVRTGIFDYYLKSIENGMLNKQLFSDQIMSQSKLIPCLKTIEELIYRQRIDLQIAFPLSKQGYSSLITKWLFDHGIREENLQYLFGYLGIPTDRPWNRKIASATSFREVNFFGYFDSTLGLTEAAKSFFDYLLELKFALNPVNVNLERSSSLDNFGEEKMLSSAVNIFSINSDNLSETMKIFDFHTLNSRYNIGIFFWEVEVLSENFCVGLDLVDEIWTTSEYVKQILKTRTCKPIFVFPLLPNTRMTSLNKPSSIPEDYFLTIFDFFSDIDRKNPWTLIEAFKIFVLEDANAPHLIIKTLNSEYFAAERERLLFEIVDCPKILWIDENWDKSTLNLVIKNSKAFFSTHRAEGFGLTLLEAMSLGTLTVATNYSGNLEFMNAENSLLIDFELVPIRAQTRAYRDLVGYWAQPNHSGVLDALRFVSDPSNKSKIETLVRNAMNDVNSITSGSPHLVFLDRRFRVIKLKVNANRFLRFFRRL
jgi:glycosyltransferase involved in cell wall biosynthesis